MLQKDSASTQRTVTLKDVEEGAVTLRKVGESLAGLKGELAKRIPTTGNHNILVIAKDISFILYFSYI